MEDRIKVIDSPCGTGKTSWAIDYINSLPDDQKIIYITPFLNECQRVQRNTNKGLIQPDSQLGRGRKRDHLLRLLSEEKNIASTHALFSNIDDDIINTLKSHSYILILDEAFQVLDKFDMWDEFSDKFVSPEHKDNLTETNIRTLLSKEFIAVDDDYKVRWIDTEHPIDKYNSLRNMADRGLIYLIRNRLLMWTFPCEVFFPGVFDEIYILTYQFDYQIQKYYYDYFNVEYSKYHIESINRKYEIVKTIDNQYEMDWINRIKPLIHILDNSKMNKIGDLFYDPYTSRTYNTALSKAWYQKNEFQISKMRNNIVNFFINIANAKSSDKMWTCFESDKTKFRCQNLPANDKIWVALNSRSTNDYGHKTVLAYPLNRFFDPFYEAFFQIRHISMDENGFALSEMLQWIWRSAIRNNKEINIYIPSYRMRNLLIDFLDIPKNDSNIEPCGS